MPQDKFCDLALNDTDPGDTMMTALRDAMAWPTWNTLWTKRYPALGNITWFPGSTVNNTVTYNSKAALCVSVFYTLPASPHAIPQQQHIDRRGSACIRFAVAVGSSGSATLWNATNLTWRGGGYRLGGEFGSLGQRFRLSVGNWNGSSLQSVGFVSNDPLGDQNFLLKEGSSARKSMGGAWQDIPTVGYGPRSA